MNKKYIIYLHKNKINGKVYIGQTCQKPEYRWNSGKGYNNCSLFYKAIQKYGWENFEHIILLENLTKEQANKKEQEYIGLYQSNDKNKGYNIQFGGNNHSVSEESRKKSSINAKKQWENEEFKKSRSEYMKQLWQSEEYRNKQQIYRDSHTKTISPELHQKMMQGYQNFLEKNGGHPSKGKPRTEEVKKKISNKMKGANNPMFGKVQPQERKDKIRQTKIQNGSFIKIRCLETNEIFESISDAARWCGLKSSSGFSDYFAGRKKSAGKHPITKQKLHWEKVLEEK